MFDFREQTVLVTGGATGIGRATSEAFARAGARVVVADVNDFEGAETVSHCVRLGAEAIYVHCDVGSDEDVASLFTIIADRFGTLHCAFNNADIEGQQASVAELPMEAWARVININLSGVYRCLHHEARIMRAQQHGTIVNCASILGVVGFANTSAYTAAKHGVVGLTKSAALDLASVGVRVNAVCPAFIETPMLDRAGITSDAEVRSAMEAMHPLARLGHSSEVADAVLWLCSSQSTFVTGHALMIDGGYVAR